MADIYSMPPAKRIPTQHKRPAGRLLLLGAVALSSISIGACGQASGIGDSSSSPAPTAAPSGYVTSSDPADTAALGGYLKSDDDNDNDDAVHPRRIERTDALTPQDYGSKASAADAREVSTLVKRYYMLAAAGRGDTACPLLYPTLAAGLSEGGSGSGHAGCAAALDLLFKEQHGLLAGDEVATMTVVDVHVKGQLALATVGFRSKPVGTILLRRQGRGWKLDALLDTGLG